MWKSDVLEDKQFRYSEATGANKIIDGASRSKYVATNHEKQSKEKVSTLVYVPLSDQKRKINNLHKIENMFW